MCHASVIQRFGSLPIASLRETSAVKLLVPKAGKAKRISSMETACWGDELCGPHKQREEDTESDGNIIPLLPSKISNTQLDLAQMENGGEQ